MSLALRPLLAPGGAACQLRAASRARPARPRAAGRTRAFGRVLVASSSSGDGKTPDGTASKTLSNLDAVLGVVDEPPAAEATQVRPARRPEAAVSALPLGFLVGALYGPANLPPRGLAASRRAAPQEAPAGLKVEVAEGLMAKIQAADAARFGATPPPNSTPEELDRFMQNLKARGADKPLSEADQMAMVRPQRSCDVLLSRHRAS